MCPGVRSEQGQGRWPPRPSSHLVRPVLLMDVEDVDAQPVPLLEGPFAERAGELPVTLVHTGGVLEVFISVVSVGKHLSTSVTSVTFCGLCRHRGTRAVALSATSPHCYFLQGSFKKSFLTGKFKHTLKSKQ